MAGKKDKEVKEVLEEAPRKAASAPVVKEEKPKPVVVTMEKQLSFDQWASMRGVKKHHRGGMLAFLKNKNRQHTLAEWDKIFLQY